MLTSGNVFVSHTVHTDADNPLNVIDPMSVGVIDCEVYSDATGILTWQNITNHPVKNLTNFQLYLHQ